MLIMGNRAIVIFKDSDEISAAYDITGSYPREREERLLEAFCYYT